MTDAQAKAAVLTEALPYLQRFRGKTFLIKMGGSAMDDPQLVREVMRDIVFLEVAGIQPIIVHGGGKAISAAMMEAGLEAKFEGGFRITTPEAITIVEQTLHGKINTQLVEMLHAFQGKATGLHGASIFQAEKLLTPDGTDIGRVGRVANCHTNDILSALNANLVPVISPLGKQEETGDIYNINADLAAAALACALQPAKLVYLSDVPGLLENPEDPTSLIQSVTREEAIRLIDQKVITGGMIPKIQSASEALHQGVEKVHFINGRMPHALLLEIFTQDGIGTEIRSS